MPFLMSAVPLTMAGSKGGDASPLFSFSMALSVSYFVQLGFTRGVVLVVFMWRSVSSFMCSMLFLMSAVPLTIEGSTG